MLNVPSGEAPVGPLLAPHKPKKEEEKYEEQGDKNTRANTKPINDFISSLDVRVAANA